MSAGTISRRKMRFVAKLELMVAAGIVLFWVAFFTADMNPFSGPHRRDIYMAFESSLPGADLLLALFLVVGGTGMLRQKAYGSIFTLVSAGGLIFLGAVDISFNLKQGIYGLGPVEAIMNGLINLTCLGVGFFLIRTIWQVWIKGQEKAI
jgi:hypothetical protein